MNISIFKGFAVNAQSIEKCKHLIEKEFAIQFTVHESSYTGQYFKAIFLNSTLTLFNNYNEIEKEWTASEYKLLNIILSVSISRGKKVERLDTDKIICEKLAILNFQLVSDYEKKDR